MPSLVKSYLNPFVSRRQNVAICNWRILRLRGMVATARHLMSERSAQIIERQVEKEIRNIKKISAK